MITERVDDIPLLVAEFEKSKLSELLNQFFPDHGNWLGLSSGKVTVGFLTYILSCSDHRISHVETWAKERLNTLQFSLDTDYLSAKDFTDDKLGSLLDRYSDENCWKNFEHTHNQNLINVYNLKPETEAIRLDAMITQSHREAKGDFQFGHSKQHRADLPQLKTMIATLDPLSMPLCSVTVSGNTADDVLYLPVINELLENLPLLEQLFVGDSKMGSIKARGTIQKKEHYYLVPLSKKQCKEDQLLAYLAEKPTDLVQLRSQDKDGIGEIKAEAFEKMVRVENEALGICWEERRLIVYSPTYAERQKIGLETRLDKGLKALNLILKSKQGRKQPQTLVDLEQMVNNILKQYRVGGLIDIQIKEEISTKRVRKHLDRPTEIRKSAHFTLDFEVNRKAKAQKINQLGWRVYACNAPMSCLNTSDAILCYRNEYKIEHKFNELLNKITALMPVFIQKEHRIKSLIRLLLLALKYVSLIEYQVRNELKVTNQIVKELYPGNPTRATDKPTANMLLRAFKNITLVIIPMGNKNFIKVSDLKPIQLKVLELLKIPPEIYTGLNQLNFSNIDFSET